MHQIELPLSKYEKLNRFIMAAKAINDIVIRLRDDKFIKAVFDAHKIYMDEGMDDFSKNVGNILDSSLINCSDSSEVCAMLNKIYPMSIVEESDLHPRLTKLLQRYYKVFKGAYPQVNGSFSDDYAVFNMFFMFGSHNYDESITKLTIKQKRNMPRDVCAMPPIEEMRAIETEIKSLENIKLGGSTAYAINAYLEVFIDIPIGQCLEIWRRHVIIKQQYK